MRTWLGGEKRALESRAVPQLQRFGAEKRAFCCFFVRFTVARAFFSDKGAAW